MTNQKESLDDYSLLPVWRVFPVQGLEILDGDAGFDNPIFEDATLMSFGSLAREIRSCEGIVEKHQGLEDSLGMWGLNHQTEFLAFLAVRRKVLVGPNNLAILSQKPVIRRKGLEEERKVERRASEIAAALGLLFFRDVGPVFTSCSLEHVTPSPPARRDGFVDFDTAFFTFSVGTRYPYVHPQVTQIKRDDLLKKIETSDFDEVLEILLWPGKKVRKGPLRQVVCRSADRAVRALIVTDIADRLLSAVTAIEILLATDGTKFQVVQTRLNTLLGDEVCKVCRANQVFESRHGYVHRGEQIDKEIADNAVRLAMFALRIYATVSRHLGDKQSILTYLDLRHKHDALLGQDPGWLREYLETAPFHPQPRIKVPHG